MKKSTSHLLSRTNSHLFDPKSLEVKEREIVIQLFLPCFDQSDTNDLPRLTEALDQLGSSRPLSDKTTFIHHHKCDKGESRKSIQRLQRFLVAHDESELPNTFFKEGKIRKNNNYKQNKNKPTSTEATSSSSRP